MAVEEVITEIVSLEKGSMEILRLEVEVVGKENQVK